MAHLTLKDCCKFQEGYVNPAQNNPEYFDGKIKWLRAVDLNDGFVYNTSRTLTETGYNSAGKSAFMFPRNSLAISKSGSIGLLGILEDEMCGNRAVINIDVDTEKVPLLYIFYLLKYKRQELIKKAVGSIQKNLYVSALETVSLCHTDYIEFKQVTEILSSIDFKIANNNKISAELEALAKTIYDYWFLQFEFPNNEGKPYRSSGGKMVWNEELKREIPEGWGVDKIGNHVQVSRGISYSSADLEGEGIPMLNLNSFNANYTYKPEGLKTFSGTYKMSSILNPYDLVVSLTQQTSIDLIHDTDVIGKSFLVPDIFDCDVVSSMDVCKLNADEMMNKYYLNLLYQQKFYRKYITGFANGTKIKHLNIDGILDFKFIVPGKRVLENFTVLAKSCEEKRSAIIKENRDLGALRDFLLPLLMNGQVGFKE